MSRRVTLVTLALVAVVAFLVGAIVAGGVGRPAVSAGATPAAAARPVAARASNPIVGASLVSFAAVVERLNPAVVNIDTPALGRHRRPRSRGALPATPDPFASPSDVG